MKTEASLRRTVRFGVFEADLQTGQLRKNGRKMRLQEKPFQFLTLLLERPGEIVTREELRDRLWNGNSSFDFDHSAANALNKLRFVLGDSADNPRFVETVPRHGYRFIAPVEGLEPKPTSHLWLWALASTILVAGITGYAVWPGSDVGPNPGLPVVPLTSYRGVEIYPELSPDGNDVAFSWNNEQAGNFDIYRRQTGPGETLVQLTNDPADELNPVWSPDGRSIAFLRFVGGEDWDVVVSPALPGVGHTVGQVSLDHEFRTHSTAIRALAWSPDGRWLAVSDRSSARGPRSIFLLSVNGGGKQRLTEPPSFAYGDFDPSFSPDGQTLVFSRLNQTYGTGDLYLIQVPDAADGDRNPRRIAAGFAVARFPNWSSDGREIIFVGENSDGKGIWRTAISGRGDALLVHAGPSLQFPSLSRDGRRLVFAHDSGNWGSSVWSVELTRRKRSPSPRRLIDWLWGGSYARYSPDGVKVVFQSGHSGGQEIWLCNADGTELQPLTNLGPGWAGSPRWSPDGRQVAFDQQVGDQWDLFTISVIGRQSSRRTTNPASDYAPSWSHDGQWIYFTSDRDGLANVWRMPVDGGDAIRLTQGGGDRAIESVEGLRVYYWRDECLWSVSSGGGDESLLLESVRAPGFSVVADGIYFMRGPQFQDEATVEFYRFSTGQTETLLTLTGMSLTPWGAVSVSPNGRNLLYHRIERREADLMLVENFR